MRLTALSVSRRLVFVQDLFSQSGARGRLLDKISGHQLKLLDAQSELDAVRFGLHEVHRQT